MHPGTGHAPRNGACSTNQGGTVKGRTLTRIGSVIAAAAALVAASTVPASANDVRAVIWHNDVRRAVATYDDLTDTLCLRLDTTRRAVAVIHAPGEPTQRGHDVELWWESADHYHCTGNLSIPED